MVKQLGFVGFMLVMIKAILYERTVALCVSMDLGNSLGRSFRGESFQAVDCTGSDNQTHNNQEKKKQSNSKD